MVSMSYDPAAGVIGLQLVDIATRGLASGAAASPAVTALVPAGAEEISAQAAAAFAAEGAAMLAVHTAAQEEVARAGVALTDIARVYSQVDGEAAGTLTTSGYQFSGQAFVGGSGAGMLRAGTLPGADGSAARTPLLAKLLDGVPAPGPGATVAAAAPNTVAVAPGAAGAASTVLGAATAPLSSVGSIGQGAAAGSTAGPGLASSLTRSEDDGARDDSADREPGERLV